MGNAIPHLLGRNRRFYAKAESSFATFAKPAGTDAIKVLKSSFDFKQERKDRMDSRQTRSVLERITARKEVSWTLEAYLVPSGAAGTAPDIGPLLKALLGTETVNASTSVVYTPSSAQSMGSLSMVHEFNTSFMEAVRGAWVEQGTLKIDGGNEPRLEFQGGASDHGGAGVTTLDGALSGGETAVTITDAFSIDVGTVISIGSSTNHEVTAVNAAGTGLTVTPAVSGAQSNGASVTPYVPTETTAGSPIAGVVGSFTVDGTTVLITAAEVTIKNNYKALTDEAFASAVSDVIAGFREVSGTLTIRARRDVMIQFQKRKTFTTRDLVLVCGNAAGKILTVDMNQVEFEFSALEIPEAEEGTFQVPFKALGSSGEDEISLTFT